MKFTFRKKSFYFYTLTALLGVLLVSLLKPQPGSLADVLGQEKRVIKCEVPLPGKLVQNLYYVAKDLQTAKQLLFNSKQGLFFDNKLYIKTADFKGQPHVVSFDNISCDAVGTQVSLTSL
jgi:hypothetical protein